MTWIAPAARPETHAGQDGLAELHFERRGDRTRLAKLLTRSPFTVQRALYSDERRPDMAHVILANPTAGLLADDRHSVCVHVGPGARASVTTQAATKVLSMPRGRAEQVVCLSVNEAGTLEYLPRPVIPFRSASLEQRVEIEIADGGTMIYGDVLSLGRVQSGERLVFRSLALDLSVRRPHGPDLYAESYRLTPMERSMDEPGILGVSAVAAVGTLIVVAPRPSPGEMIDRLGGQGEWAAGRIATAELPGGGGIILKALATSASEAEALLCDAATALVRPRIGCTAAPLGP